MKMLLSLLILTTPIAWAAENESRAQSFTATDTIITGVTLAAAAEVASYLSYNSSSSSNLPASTTKIISQNISPTIVESSQSEIQPKKNLAAAKLKKQKKLANLIRAAEGARVRAESLRSEAKNVINQLPVKGAHLNIQAKRLEERALLMMMLHEAAEARPLSDPSFNESPKKVFASSNGNNNVKKHIADITGEKSGNAPKTPKIHAAKMVKIAGSLMAIAGLGFIADELYNGPAFYTFINDERNYTASETWMALADNDNEASGAYEE